MVSSVPLTPTTHRRDPVRFVTRASAATHVVTPRVRGIATWTAIVL